jgi:hypothetical protein
MTKALLVAFVVLLVGCDMPSQSDDRPQGIPRGYGRDTTFVYPNPFLGSVELHCKQITPCVYCSSIL